MPTDMSVEAENFNGCLDYVIITLELNLFNIILRLSQMFAFILAKMTQCNFIVTNVLYFSSIFCTCFVVYCFVIESW